MGSAALSSPAAEMHLELLGIRTLSALLTNANILRIRSRTPSRIPRLISHLQSSCRLNYLQRRSSVANLISLTLIFFGLLPLDGQPVAS